MEIIRKEISIDKSRSHKGGLLPFVQYETGVYIHSGVTSANTNYGHYVCDLALKLSGETKGTKTYEELSAITLSTLTIGDKYLVSNSHGNIYDFTYTPENTIYMWNGNRWVFYEKTLKYLDIINRYYDIKDIIKKSYFCKRVTNKNNDITLKVCPSENIIGEFSACTMSCEENLYSYTVLDKNDFNVYNKGANFHPKENVLSAISNGEYFVLISDYNLYLDIEKWGGDLGLSAETTSNGFTVKKYIEDNILYSSGASNTFFLVSPTVDVPILLNQECTYDGLYFPYEYILDGPNIEEVIISGLTYSAKVGTNVILYADYIAQNSLNETENNVATESNVNLPVMCESRLEKLKHYNASEIVEGYLGVSEGWYASATTSALTNENIVQVITEKYNAGQLFSCKFYTSAITFEEENKIYPNLVNNNVYQVIVSEETDDSISWWECIINDDPISAYTSCESLTLPENEEDDDKKYYQNVVTLGCIPYYNIGLVETGEIYYFKAFYQNGKINPSYGSDIMSYDTIKKVSFPFVVGEPVNIETYPTGEIAYDMVLSANTYEEIGKYYCDVEYVLGATSGQSGTGIFYKETLNYNSGVTKNVFIDNVFESELWYESLDYDSNLREHYNEIYGTNFLVREAQITKFETNNTEYIDYPLITRDGMESLYNSPIISTDIIFNRGAAAGCEKHFKLSECNTFQDLKKYGNNIFNL